MGFRRAFRHIEKSLVPALFCLLSVFGVHAQTGMLSPYSFYDPGTIQPYLNVRNMSMGGIGIGLSGRGDLNPFNPGTYRTGVDTLSVRFDIGFNVSMNALTQKRDGEKIKNQSTSGGLSNLEFYFPVCKWYKMAIYLLPMTDMYYNTSYYTDNGDLYPYLGDTRLTFAGKGGVSKVGWGHSLGWGPVSVGFNANYLFGKFLQTSTMTFMDDSLASYAGEAEFSTETRMNGYSFDVGLSVRIPLKPSQYLTIGAAYSLEGQIFAKRTTLAQGVFSAYSDTAYMPESEVKGKIVLPSTLRGGISYEYTNQFLIGADFSYTFWNAYRYFGEHAHIADYTYSVQVGAELKSNPQASSVARRFAYRIGGFFNTDRVVYGGRELQSYGISLGLGIPIRKSRSVINVGLQLGQSGSLRKGQIREDFMRIGISFSDMETWFVKPKYD